jgi:hypothetical protein
MVPSLPEKEVSETESGGYEREAAAPALRRAESAVVEPTLPGESDNFNETAKAHADKEER